MRPTKREMDMKNIFTAEELKCGMFVIKNSVGRPIKNLDSARSEVYQIVYLVHEEGTMYCLSGILTDGFTLEISNTLEGVADYLNQGEEGYRPLTKDELFQLANSFDRGFY